jgi:hypothetical protein
VEPAFLDVGGGLVSRLLSSLIAIIYVGLAFQRQGARTGIEVMLFCTLPLSCIWFPEAMGAATATMGRNSRDAPPMLVWLLGWGLLLMPMILTFFVGPTVLF